jgi:hypothetical protein
MANEGVGEAKDEIDTAHAKPRLASQQCKLSHTRGSATLIEVGLGTIVISDDKARSKDQVTDGSEKEACIWMTAPSRHPPKRHDNVQGRCEPHEATV